MGAGCDLGGQLVTPKYFRAIVRTVPLTVYGSGFSATTESELKQRTEYDIKHSKQKA